MENHYRAVFFDWDGTAVENRHAPVDQVVQKMKPLLRKGIRMIIVSGTTYEKIAEGGLHTLFHPAELDHLYLGLARGAHNYSFQDGKPVLHEYKVPDINQRLALHNCVFEIHQKLLKDYGMDSDIVFVRPNYCKIDLLSEHDRKGKLFLQEGETEMLQKRLMEHGIMDGLQALIHMVEDAGKQTGLKLKATTDAKFLEIGLTTKSDNVDYFVETVLKRDGISVEESCFWGDEFAAIADGIFGSDAYMITEATKNAQFFDVSPRNDGLPEGVQGIGGGIASFLSFLESLHDENE